jgi:uroporphyrinogen decarboxylase
MTPRERLQTVLRGGIPDRVPVMPDISNMIPCRLTGKPYWDIYLYNDPPLWQAYIDAADYFDLDSLMDGYFPLHIALDPYEGPAWERFIVFRSDERIITRAAYEEGGKLVWAPTVDVYYVADPPTHGVPYAKIGLPEVPDRWEPLEGVKPLDTSVEGFRAAKARLGDRGLLGAYVTSTCAIGNDEGIYHYYDNPDRHERWAEERVADAERRFRWVMDSGADPDFLCVGGSGTLIWQTVSIFRQLALPAVKRTIELATAAGLPTHIHSCGPERELVRIMAEETALTVIDPLEIAPMGDCDLAELKRLWGDRIVLKGNLHTTEVMLRGTPEDVTRAARQAIDDAAEGGRFILSTGDQCGRDTPFANLEAIVEAAKTYGRY